MFITWDHYRDWLKDELLEPQQVFPAVDIPKASDFVHDSRSVQPGQWFVPIVGEYFDGHAFVEQAITKGAQGFFYQPESFHCEDKDILALGIPVKDTLKSLQAIAHGWRNELKYIQLAALTGSSGKTTTKNFVGCILSATNKTSFMSHANFNNEIGVALNLLQLTEEHSLGILEFGARHKGDIRFLTELAQPGVVACLNVGSSHIDEFGDAETLLQTKAEIFSASPTDATVIVNYDQKDLLQQAQKSNKTLLSFGSQKGADFYVQTPPHLDGTKLHFTLSILNKPYEFSIPCLNNKTPINAAAACAIAHALGIKPETMQKGLAQYTPAIGRFRPVSLPSYLLIDDAYNANPESMEAGLESLEEFFPDYSKFFVLGDMLELGVNSPQAHFDIGKKLSKINRLSGIWALGPESKQLLRGAEEGGVNPARLQHFDDLRDLLDQETPFSTDDKRLVYVKSSWSTGLHKYVAELEKRNS